MARRTRRSTVVATDSGTAATSNDASNGALDPPGTVPATGERATAEVGAAKPWKRLVVGRARQHRLDIQLANCSITDVEARAYVLGLFREVAPTGAAGVIDRCLEGAVTEFTRRRMFSGGIGEVFIMPANRRHLRADMVLFAGLGFFDQFNDDVQQTTAESVIRTFIKTRVEDFATVLVGAASGLGPAQLLCNLLQGYVRGKLDADVDHHFRRIVICELDRTRYEEIRAELYRLASTSLFEEIEVMLTELPPPTELDAAAQPARLPARAADGATRDPAYLLVRRERADRGASEFRTSVLTVDAKAAVISAVESVDDQQLDALLEKLRLAVDQNRFGLGEVQGLGDAVGKLLLGDAVASVLPKLRDRHLIVVHDGPSSRIPWESLRIGSWVPALESGMSRRYMAENLSVAKYLDQRPLGSVLEVLLVVDPTSDLKGARDEGERIASVLEKARAIHVTRLFQGEAKRAAVLKHLRSGKYDLVHYAGHAFFDAEVPGRSGLSCTDEPLTGIDLANLGSLPRLVFFNACESGRVRRRGAPKKQSPAELRKERLAPAEAFLRGGIANFIGTYWPVGDRGAEDFSTTFYELAAAGQSLGKAVLEARKVVRNQSRSADWADYIHFGDYASTLR